ncbi:MAG: response regulator transcription factor [Paucibacter sp.]|nr:response regulator transcription factor [Roseateles sp.]
MLILLVEDDETIARELTLRWHASGWETLAATTLAQAQQLVQQAPDVVVLDRQLPDGDGLAWLERQRQAQLQAPVLILTARDRVSDRVEGLRRGADDYLVKPFAPEELDARLEVIRRRLGRDKGQQLRFGPLLWSRDDGGARIDGTLVELLPREFEVLGLLMRRAPALVPKRVIVDALSERNEEVSDAAAEVYVSRLRRKLAGSGLVIQTARGFGYRLVLEGESTGER